MNIRKETLSILEKAGWHIGRKIDIRDIEKYLEKCGYDVFAPVKRFIEEFGMLEIEVYKPNNLGEKHEIHHTNAEKAIGDYYTQGSFKQEEIYAAERLVPVGEIDNGNLSLLVSESGKVYCNTGKLGDDFLEALENLISGSGVKSWGSF